MKSHFQYLFLLSNLVAASLLMRCSDPRAAEPHNNPQVVIDDVAEVLEHMKVYFLEVYDMPADSLMDYRPTDDVMTFREHAAHVLTNLYVQHECFLTNDTTTNMDPAIEHAATLIAIQDRAALRQRLADQFDDITRYLRTMDTSGDWNKQRVLPQFDGQPSKDLVTILMLMRDHVTHHRAQMIVYLRLMGYVPPDYMPF